MHVLILIYVILNFTSSEHQELAERLERLSSEPSRIQDSVQWKKQLEHLVVQMESKKEQISIVARQLQGSIVRPRKASIVHRHKSQELMNPRAASLDFLHSMKAIQKTLQQGDLSWD